MTKEKQFEERLNSLILLKALLIKDHEFDEVTQKDKRQSSSYSLPNCLLSFCCY